MEVTGVGIGFIDVPAEHTQAYNTWYDQDHVPKNLALAEVTGARRYVATPDCKEARPPVAMEQLSRETGAYCTIYQFCGDVKAAAASWHALGQDLRGKKRMFRHGNVPYSGVYGLKKTLARGGIPVAKAAVPYLGHQGILVALTQVADASMREAVDTWFEEVHGVDLLDVPGVAAAMRYAKLEGPDEGHSMNLYLLDGDPVSVAKEVEARRETWLAKGRLPSPGGASKVLFMSVYRSVVQTQYDFETA